ncbi:inovirus-type Gp2 protein [Psychrobacter glacincola]|uniref:YagK/YfjJ domain-containing protein n=1 Tax=Psychrobacter glacincola TaxID=56810 RepID=UPI0039AF87EB
MTTLSLSHDYVVAQIDTLVNAILSPNAQISIKHISEQLNIYYEAMALLSDDELDYCNTINWFMGSCYLVCGNHYPNEFIWDRANTERFVTALRSYQYEFATDIVSFANQERRNSRSLYRYMSYFLNKYARALIVRVDIKIKAEFAHLVNIKTFYDFMDDFNDKVGRKRGCFEHLRGHAWAIEQGVETGGLHCHLLLIYNGDKRQNDWFLGDAVGRLWVEITDGMGTYFNGNTSKHKQSYKRKGTLGIGMIHKDNPIEVDSAMYTAMYLVRPEKYKQRLKAKMSGRKSFGRGI